MGFDSFCRHVDPFLIFFYRLTGNTMLDYLLGTFVLALITVVIGEITISLLFRVNRREITQTNNDMVHMQNLSILALRARNKAAFKACNKEANDAFGKAFFMQIAMGSSSFWPILFALSWMQYRFFDVRFRLPFPLPFVGDTVGYAFTFFPLYVLARICFNRFKYRIPYFKGMQKMLKESEKSTETMLSFADVMGKPERKGGSDSGSQSGPLIDGVQ